MNMPVMQPDAIVMMEDHDKAYVAWKERNARDRILVHVDAHIDFGWVPETDLDEIGAECIDPAGRSKNAPLLNPYVKSRRKMINIGNYICPAMREGIVKKFYWVVPDKSWQTARGKKHIVGQLKRILKIRKYCCARPEIHADHIRCRIFDRELIVCSLDNLERIEEPVLLDIDVDYMLTPSIWDDLNPGRTPWIFPEDIFEKIASRIRDIDVLTIAYSVEGGFTPLRFKYLGDELRLLFAGRLSDDGRKIMVHRRTALLCEATDQRREAADEYAKVLSIDDADASAYFNLFLLSLDRPAALGEARHFYEQALSRDRSYATAYNNYGILYLRYNRLTRAQAEYERLPDLNRDDPAVLNGLGHISLARRRYARAGEFFDRCLAIDRNHPDARTGKGVVFYRQGKLHEAEKLFAACSKDEPDDAWSYWWLGCIACKRQDAARAIDCFKRAVVRGGEGPLVHLVLARLYLSRRLYYRAFEEIKRSLRSLRANFYAL